MSITSIKQVLAEIISDYRYNLKMGMPVDESLEVFKMMVVEMIEFEKKQAFDLGRESGTYGILHDLHLFGAEHVIEKYSD